MTMTTDDGTTTGPSAAGAAHAPAALAGVLAALAALAAAEVVAALLSGARSPVTSIGAAVIDVAPPALKDAAIDAFGTADKPVLIGAVLVVLGLCAAGIGVLAARRPWSGTAGIVGLGAVGLLAAVADGAASGVAAAMPAAAATAVGVAALWWLVSTLDAAARPDDATDGDPTPADDASGAPDALDPGRSGADAEVSRPSRRGFVRASAVVGGFAVVAGGFGRWLDGRTGASDAVTIPRAIDEPPPIPTSATVPVDGVPPFVTPNAEFYRIDTALQVPRIDVDTWRLRIDGMVDDPLELTFDQMLDRYDVVAADITLACVSNEIGGDLVGTARWHGVRLTDVLADVGVRDAADQLVGRAFDGFTTGAPLAAVLDGRASLIAVGMNGVPLPAAHGAPARLIVPGLYGYVSATKWLTEIEVTTFDAFDAYWVPRGWAERAPVKTQSRIDVPRALATVAPGPVAVAGVAWAPTRGIEQVEVKVDDRPWEPARLGAGVNVDTWRQWIYDWDARPGRHELAVRATDGRGVVQVGERTPPRPDGATGHHRIVVTVSDA